MSHSEAIESFVNLLEEKFTECPAPLGAFLAYLTVIPEAPALGSDPYAWGEWVFQWFRKNGDTFLGALRSRDALIKWVESWPDEHKVLLPSITGLYKLAPEIIKQETMQAAHIIASENPVRVGRPKVTRSKEYDLKIVKAVSLVYEKRKVRIGVAQQKVADDHDLSLRTVQEIWRNREITDIAEPSTLPDLVKDFSNLFKRPEDAQSTP